MFEIGYVFCELLCRDATFPTTCIFLVVSACYSDLGLKDGIFMAMYIFFFVNETITENMGCGAVF